MSLGDDQDLALYKKTMDFLKNCNIKLSEIRDSGQISSNRREEVQSLIQRNNKSIHDYEKLIHQMSLS